MTIDEEKRTTLRKFAAVGATPLLGLADRDESESETREAIVGYVETTPGAHFSKIRDDLSLATGETQYHLRRLTDSGSLEHCRDGNYKRYFSAGEFGEFEKVTLGYLRRETPRKMLVAILEDPERTGTDLASKLGVSTAAISAAATEMSDAGLLDTTDGYQISNPEMVISLLLRYGRTFDDETRRFSRDAAALFTYDPE
ncbi:MAG: winged helix-turn-helix transcriptional regulator [Halodesulfurarchaeum sp.]